MRLALTSWRKELSLAAALALLALFAYGHLLEGGATPYSRHSDLVAQHLAMKNVGYQSMQAGEGLPLWKTDLLGGGPALTHPQALFTNPLQFLFLLFEPTAAAGPTLLLHFLAMALSMQVLGAVMGLGFPARAFMAVAGLFSFKMIVLGYSGWLPVLPGLVLAPLLFAAVLEVARRPGPASGLLLSIAGVLALHGGHLQVFYYSTLALSVYLGVRLIGWLRDRRFAHARQVAAWSGIGAVLGLIVSLGLSRVLENVLFELSDAFEVDGKFRTSVIIDPKNGQFPPMTSAGQKQMAKLISSFSRRNDGTAYWLDQDGPGPYDNMETRDNAERCLLGFSGAAPSIPSLYNNYERIVQSDDYVMILIEMVHDARIVRMNSEHPGPKVTKWLGDSIGWWEDDTLVVDTTNFNGKGSGFLGGSQKTHVVERFTKLADGNVLYNFTMEDDSMWKAPWTGEYLWRTSDQKVYEYACHEGNYSFGNIMRGARILEQDALAAKQSEGD